MTTYYKTMMEDGSTIFGRDGWYLPKGKRPGRWMPKVTPQMCVSGYHVCTLEQLPLWIGPAIYEVEVRGEYLSDNSKAVFEQARLIRRVTGWGMNELVEWAQQCADHVQGSVAAEDAEYAAEYARDVARYAAESAAESARDARYAAESARDVARDTAELQWQASLIAEKIEVRG